MCVHIRTYVCNPHGTNRSQKIFHHYIIEEGKDCYYNLCVVVVSELFITLQFCHTYYYVSCSLVYILKIN